MSFVAALDSAQQACGMAVRGTVLTRSPSQATLYSQHSCGSCVPLQFFLSPQWKRFVEECESLLPTYKISPHQVHLFYSIDVLTRWLMESA